MHVLLYTYGTCSFCDQARSLLQARDIPFHEQRLDGDRQTLARLRQLFGKSAMPYVLVDGEPVGGLDELRQLVRSGELD